MSRVRVVLLMLGFALAALFPASLLSAQESPDASIIPCRQTVSMLVVVQKSQLPSDPQSAAPVYPQDGVKCWFSIKVTRAAEVPLKPDGTCEMKVFATINDDGTRGAHVSPSDGDCTGVATTADIFFEPVAVGEAAYLSPGVSVSRLDEEPRTYPSVPTDHPEAVGQLSSAAPSRQGSSGGLSPLTSSTGWIQAKIIGWDCCGLPMFWNYVNEQHDYNGSTVTYAQMQWAHWTDQYWYVVGNTHQLLWGSGNTYVDAYNYTSMHSDGFLCSCNPDTHAYVQPSVFGYGNGSQACSFYNVWVDPYPGFDFGPLCSPL